MTNLKPTACVVGAGIIGSWAALHLAEAGVSTVLVEQFPLPHTRGSSHGMSRAFRLLGDDTLDRLDYSLDRWRGLEDSTGETLFVRTGLLNFGPLDDPYLHKYMSVLRNGDRPVEWLESDVIAARFPMLRYPEDWGAAWDPSGGLLIAHRCLSAVQSRFLELGGKIVTAAVESIESEGETGARIALKNNTTGERETRRFDRAVVCAGPWATKLLPQLGEILRSVSTPVTYWRDPSGQCSAANGCPILFNARLTDMYALPSCEYPDLVKVLFHGGPETDPDNRDLADLEPFVRQAGHYVRDHLPQLDHRKPAILEPCMYTMTPDENPVLDRLDGSLVVGCGFSGSGFKHSPATGQMLAALALEQEERLPDGYEMSRYRVARFQKD